MYRQDNGETAPTMEIFNADNGDLWCSDNGDLWCSEDGDIWVWVVRNKHVLVEVLLLLLLSPRRGQLEGVRLWFFPDSTGSSIIIIQFMPWSTSGCSSSLVFPRSRLDEGRS
ncbi:hypothetical protein LOK49_LG07G00763 [Camellia lanceoleosa]|uniref:Uncharacterized protein n=1 Tax=Camellia lanceoleosa TaxID=1840588 RepID=A0ACC0H620_9ERIC|nr:hypothetical protein LOK49_LG07G00763 [Camellia lanceoleosa]